MYVIFHFLLFPSGQERFWGVYIGCTMVPMMGDWYREPLREGHGPGGRGLQLPVEADGKSELAVQPSRRGRDGPGLLSRHDCSYPIGLLW